LTGFLFACLIGSPASSGEIAPPHQALKKIHVSSDRRGFVTDSGEAFVPFGVTYFRPGTGWAPQVWKQFDLESTRKDFVRLRELGGNCVRVFLSYGSFYEEPGHLSADGLAKFDQFLALAEAAGLYVHPTGPDLWEGLPKWAEGDRIADNQVLNALDQFWKLFAARYRGRNVIFAYDLLNEPEVGWDTPAMRPKWRTWLREKYREAAGLSKAWGISIEDAQWDSPAAPAKDAPPGKRLLDYQLFREDLAVQWTRRQAAAIKAADPQALVTVGLIQWSVPIALAGSFHYSGFRPSREAPLLDFMEVHFYPLAGGFYEYQSEESELRNLAYLEAIVREASRFGKPTVVAEFGWYGGGKLSIDGGRHPAATEQQQARWCRRAVESTAGWACGWLNWGFHDHAGAGDVTELTGLLTADDKVKAWGLAFQELAARFQRRPPSAAPFVNRPVLNWDLATTNPKAREDFQNKYFQAFREEAK
jgi:hypothetical protein